MKLNEWAGISKEFGFCAAHHLPQLPEGHKCRRVHGHNYRVIVEVSGPLDEHGMVVDYAAFADLFDHIRAMCDHRDLNTVLPIAPTAENLAGWIRDRALSILPITIGEHLVRVRVSETPSTWAWTPV